MNQTQQQQFDEILAHHGVTLARKDLEDFIDKTLREEVEKALKEKDEIIADLEEFKFKALGLGINEYKLNSNKD